MPLLFSYGTLQQEHVQQSVFGRRVDTRPEELVGYVREAVTIGGAQEANIRYTGSGRVPGVVLDISDAELLRSDDYELPYGYKRISVRLASGTTAWAYVHA
jgi:gamma-glutamylcyclotransferase (GGCT)/AIG2-like uncharacterized protein YtfP